MALSYILFKAASQVDCSSFTINDQAVYGGANPARNTLANVLFITRTDKNAVRTLQAITPNTGDPLTVASWNINSTDDGLLEKILFSVQIWLSGGPYLIGDIVYDVAGAAFYKCSVGNSSATRPGLNLAQWGGAALPPANLYANELANLSTKMTIVLQTDLNTCRIEKTMNSEYQRIADAFNRANGKKQYEYNDADELDSVLQSAYSALANGRPYEAEEIVRNITNFVLRYGQLSS